MPICWRILARARGRGISDWWNNLPPWLKLITSFVACPAWIVVVYCILSGQTKSLVALSAFGAFVAATILHILFDRRHRQFRREDSGIGFSDGGE